MLLFLLTTNFSVFLGETKESLARVKRYIGNDDFGAKEIIEERLIV
jgi:hypothetical protein